MLHGRFQKETMAWEEWACLSWFWGWAGATAAHVIPGTSKTQAHRTAEKQELTGRCRSWQSKHQVTMLLKSCCCCCCC